ncbi:MAG: hypothetical protein IPJ82_00450 [Lewinellaceae bacterium]|nr:hypothetical protein [Lewinellaceae bacterium]
MRTYLNTALPLLLLFSLNLRSQSPVEHVKTVSGPLQTLENRAEIKGLCKGPGGTVQLLKSIPSGRRDYDPDWVLETWDLTGFQKTGTLSLETPKWEGEPLRYIEHRQRKDGALCFFWTLIDRKKRKHFLFSSFIDASGRASRLRQIHEIAMRDQYAGQFTIFHSDDQSKWMALAGFKGFSDSEWTAVVLDSSFNRLSVNNIASPYQADKAVADTQAVDNTGRVLAFISADTDTKSKKAESLRQALLIYGLNEAKPVVIPVEAPGKLLRSILFDFQEPGRVTLFGTYTGIEEKKEYFESASIGSVGTFSCTIGLSAHTAGEVRCTPFDRKYTDYFYTRKLKSQGEGLVGPTPGKVVRTKDGIRRVLVQSGGVSTYTGGNKWRTRYTSGPLIAVLYDKDGKYLSENLLLKAIAASDHGGGVGQIYVEDGENLHILYNNPAKNRGAKTAKELDYGETPESTYNGVNKDTEVWYALSQPDGSFKTKCLFEVSPDKLFMNSLLSVRSGERETVFLTGYREQYRLVKLTY